MSFVIQGGRIERASTEEHIKWCIRSVLSLQKGELVAQPDFGAELMSLMFRRDSPQLREEIKGRITGALAKAEPRIDVEGTDIAPDEGENGMLSVRIRYRIKASGRRESLKVLV